MHLFPNRTARFPGHLVAGQNRGEAPPCGSGAGSGSAASWPCTALAGGADQYGDMDGVAVAKDRCELSTSSVLDHSPGTIARF